MACRQGTLTPPDTWSRPFGTWICSTCWDQSFSERVVILPDYALRISLGTFSSLLITWEARGCGAQYVGETSQSLKGRFRSHLYKIRNNSKRKYKNFLYDHFIKYNHSIEHVKITPVEILSKLSGKSKNDMKKRRLSAELNWIKRLQTPYPFGFNDQIYQQGNISSIRSNINIFSLKPEVRRKRRSHGVRRNGLSRRKQRLNRYLDDLLRIAKNNGRHELLHALSSIPVFILKLILNEADRRILRHLDWFKLKIIMAFSFNKLFPCIPSLPPKTQFIKIEFIYQGLDLLNISNILEITESILKSRSISRILTLLLFVISTKTY